jgi:hypothetical protein
MTSDSNKIPPGATLQNGWFTPLKFALALALLVFAAFPQVLSGLQTFVVRDYGFFAYPLAHFQQECFRHHQLPLWNPYNNCGVPFLAQWNTMPLYPPTLIYLLLPLPWSLGFFCLLHLWFAGMGTFYLARRWTNNSFAAAFAGVAFAFNGLTLNLLMWPSHIATLSWLPWVVLAVELAWREGMHKIIWAAFAGALQMLAGGPETIFLAWLLLLALWVQQFVKKESPRTAMLWRFPLVMLLVIALAAAQLLPFLDLAAHSQRHVGYADTRWSLSGWGWANFLVPMAFGGHWNAGIFLQYEQAWTSSYYLGIGTLWLALLGLWTVRERRVRLLGVAAVVALILAFGENTPVYRVLRTMIPQLSLITYPIKFVTLTAFIAPLLAAFALAYLWNLPYEQKQLFQKRFLFIGGWLLCLLAIVLFWAWRFPFPTDDVPAALFNGFTRILFLLATGGLLFALMQRDRPVLRRTAPLILIVVAWLDVFTHEPAQNPTVPPGVYEPGLARAKLAMQPQPALGGSRAMITPMALFSFVHAAISNPQNNFLAKRLGYCANCNLLDDVPKVDGFCSLYPRESAELSDTLYAYLNTDFPRLEDFMGVSQITAPGKMFDWTPRHTFLPLVTAGQKPVFLDDTNTLRALTQTDFDGAKIVFLPPEAKSLVTVTNPTSAHVTRSSFGTQSADLEVEAAETSLVVVAQTYYHPWHAYVDGQPAPLLRANHAFQAVEIPSGQHHVRLVYEDHAFKTGAIISLVMWLNCLICLPLLRNRPAQVDRRLIP